jgi:hypothetical protein
MMRIVAPERGMGVQKKFYFELFPSVDLQFAFGVAQVAIGLLVVVGLFRVIVVPLQFAICAFSAATIATALLDPFALWLPVDKIAPVQHLFYPTVIILCASVLMMLLRKEDTYNLDTLFFSEMPQDDDALTGMPAE